MGRSQTGGARDRATPSAKATVAVHKRWFKRLKVLLPTFFHLLAWRSQLYFKCYRLLTATLFHFHVPAKVIWGCFSPLFGIEQTKLFFSFSCLTHPPPQHTDTHTHPLSPPTTSQLFVMQPKFVMRSILNEDDLNWWLQVFLYECALMKCHLDISCVRVA